MKKWKILTNFVASNNEPSGDAQLMIELGLSPYGWKVWKPMFISMSQKPLEKIEVDGKLQELVYLQYNKRTKSWRISSKELNQIPTNSS